jgi:hypothetical protein
MVSAFVGLGHRRRVWAAVLLAAYDLGSNQTSARLPGVDQRRLMVQPVRQLGQLRVGEPGAHSVRKRRVSGCRARGAHRRVHALARSRRATTTTKLVQLYRQARHRGVTVETELVLPLLNAAPNTGRDTNVGRPQQGEQRKRDQLPAKPQSQGRAPLVQHEHCERHHGCVRGGPPDDGNVCGQSADKPGVRDVFALRSGLLMP